MLEQVDGLDEQIAAGIRHGRTAYDDPGALLMKLRVEEPEEFAACAGAGVQGLVPDLAEFWSRYLVAARDAARSIPTSRSPRHRNGLRACSSRSPRCPGSSSTRPTTDAVLTHVRRYVMPGLRADPAVMSAKTPQHRRCAGHSRRSWLVAVRG